MRYRYAPTGTLMLEMSAWGASYERRVSDAPFVDEGGIAVVSVRDPLVHHADGVHDSYEEIQANVAAALASSAKTVMLEFDSPGGEAAGAIETARALREMAKASGKRLVGFVNEKCMSAAYALACACEMLCAPESAETGSIGVIKMTLDQTALDGAMGLKYAFFASGDHKLDGCPHVPMSAEAASTIKQGVEDLANVFFAWVGEARGVDAGKLRAMKGAVLMGQPALDAGLVDVIGGRNEFLSMLTGDKAPPARARAAATGGAGAMADYKELVASLKKMAEGDDEDAKCAQAALKKLEAEEPPAKDGDGDGEKKDAKAEGDDAPPPKDGDDDEKKDAKAKAHASSPTVTMLAASLQKVETELAKAKAEAEETKRAQMLAARPDIKPELAKSLRKMPLALMQETLASIPVAGVDPAAAVKVTATRGDGQVGEGDADGRTPRLPADEKARMDAAMGLTAPKGAIRREGTSVVFGVMDPEAARARLEKKNGAPRASGGGSK